MRMHEGSTGPEWLGPVESFRPGVSEGEKGAARGLLVSRNSSQRAQGPTPELLEGTWRNGQARDVVGMLSVHRRWRERPWGSKAPVRACEWGRG